MTRIKQRFENLKYKFSNLDVRKKRLLITTGVLAVMLPIVAVSIFAANNTLSSPGIYCDNETREIVVAYPWVVQDNLSRYLDKNHTRCDKCKTVNTIKAELTVAERAYQKAKKVVDDLNKDVAIKKIELDKANGKHVVSLIKKAQAEYDLAKTKLETAMTELTNKTNDVNKAKQALAIAKSDCQTYRNKLGGGGGGNNGSAPSTPAQSNELASSATLNFILTNGQISNTASIASNTEWGNLVLAFIQGHQNSGQPVTATIVLPQGVTLAPSQPVQYDLSTNPNNYQVLPNGETIVTTGVVAPAALGAGQFINFNIRITANVNCGTKTDFAINANVKDAAGRIISAQPATLTVNGPACPTQPAPTTPEQPAPITPITPTQPAPEANKTNFAVDLAVSPHQQNNFVDNLSVKSEQVVDFRIGYANTGQTLNKDVKISYTLPSGFTFIPGTIRLNNNKVKIGDNAINNGKLETSIGDYVSQDGAHLIFSAVADKLNCGEKKENIASVVRVSTQGISKSDTTSLSIKADACGNNNEQNIQVCELATKKVILIPESTFNESTHSKDISKCQAETITPNIDKDIQVCELATKKRTTIKESAFDSKLHSRDLSQCPLAELPNTGTSDTIMAVVILSIVTAITGYAINSRKTKRANNDKDSL